LIPKEFLPVIEVRPGDIPMSVERLGFEQDVVRKQRLENLHGSCQ
jgi:hypothetical protein